MLKNLGKLVKDKELKELFPDTPPEKAREDEEKLKEALFQVHGIIYNKELLKKTRRRTYITPEEIEELSHNEQQHKRIMDGLAGVTQTEEGIPSTDLKYVLTKTKKLWD